VNGFVTMREPRLVAETQSAPRRGPVRANPALPNLVIVKPVGRWPAGEVVAKEDFPAGFQGHLEMGVVVETERPVTVPSVHRGAAPVPAADPRDGEIVRLRAVIADYDGRIAALQMALVEREQTIKTLRTDLAAAEQLLGKVADAGDRIEAAGIEGGLRAVVTDPTGTLPVAPAPWK
jgi:hypothetical protein